VTRPRAARLGSSNCRSGPAIADRSALVDVAGLQLGVTYAAWLWSAVATGLDVETARAAVMSLLGVHLRAAAGTWKVERHLSIMGGVTPV